MNHYDTAEVEGTDSETTAGDRQRVPVARAVLVYETRDLGRELVGFEDVESWDDVADALRARGHGTGAIYHLPELDAEDSA
jgi:hypothetical protein